MDQPDDQPGPAPISNSGARIIAIVNQKGGVGKTTTTINLATALAAVKKRVLLLDMDPQGNASTSIGIDRKARTLNAYHVMIGEASIPQCIIKSEIPGLDVVAAGVDLSGAEIELVDLDRREFRLRDAIEGAELDYDYILIDCPPSLGLITLNALVAAQSVLVPLQCEFLALEGISQLVKTIERVTKHLNPTLDLQGIVLTMFDARNNLSGAVANDVREHFGDLVYDTVIPRNVRVSEAPSHGRPVIVYDMNCSGSKAYLALASELLKREKRLSA